MTHFLRMFRQTVVTAMALCAPLAAPAAMAQTTGASFVETFDKLDTSFWYISDGWNNGAHQNCTWSKDAISVANGQLVLDFRQKQTTDRAYTCGEIQTRQRYGYGTYEIRMKAATGSGLNSAFFSYIGPTDKQPHDEIDFEVLGKNTNQVQVNQYISAKGDNEKLIAVPGGADKAFNNYAFIWEKNRLRYFLNGKLVHEVTDAAKIPTHPQKIFASLWGSDTFKDWMGTFAYKGPVSMQVDRIAFTAPGEKCKFEGSVLCTLN
jgi:endo-1,3-1,4-beta-glycanase ExoK